jgi:hypothetical protein
MRNYAWIVTIYTAPDSLSLLHMTNVNFSLNVETVATSRGSCCSLTAETNQDHSIHTPHKHNQCHLGQALLHMYPNRLLSFTANLHLCMLKCLTPTSLKHNFLACVMNYMLLILLFWNLVTDRNTYIFNCRKSFRVLWMEYISQCQQQRLQ